MKLSNGLELPDNWSQVTVDQFIELRTIDREQYNTALSIQLEQLAILTGTSIDDDEWADMDALELEDVFNSMDWLRTDITRNPKKKIGDYTLKDFGEAPFSDFIELNYYFKDNYYAKLNTIAAVLYRRTKTDEWGNNVYEPIHSLSQLQRDSSYFSELPITDIYGIIPMYIQAKKEFNATYSELLEGEPVPESQNVKNADLTDKEKADVEAAERMAKRWEWERILHILSDGDITKYDAVLALPWKMVFNNLSMRKDLKL